MFDALRGAQTLFHALFGVKTLSGTLLGPAFNEAWTGYGARRDELEKRREEAWALAAALAMGLLARSMIGGQTGDVLGATPLVRRWYAPRSWSSVSSRSVVYAEDLEEEAAL